MGKTNEARKMSAAEDLRSKGLGRFGTILVDPPWQFNNRTGKVAPEHRRLSRYATLSLKEVLELPVQDLTSDQCHLYLWVPNALLAEGLQVMKQWGFTYKTNIVWFKIRRDGGPDGRGVGFYFRNVTELVLFGVKGGVRTLKPGRTQTNIIATRKREHSRKPEELYDIIERCSPGPYLELFARQRHEGWIAWGDEADCGLNPPPSATRNYVWDARTQGSKTQAFQSPRVQRTVGPHQRPLREFTD